MSDVSHADATLAGKMERDRCPSKSLECSAAADSVLNNNDLIIRPYLMAQLTGAALLFMCGQVSSSYANYVLPLNVKNA